MAAEHQQSFSKLLQDADERAADLGSSLNNLSRYLQALYGSEENSLRKSALLSTMRFISLSRDISHRLVDVLDKARTQAPDHLD